MTCWHALAFLVLGTAVSAQDVTIHDAWIAEAPPSATVLAGYARVHNAGAAPRRIVGARGDGFSAIQLHSMRDDDGVMRMRQLDSIAIPAGGDALLAPGGDHLMLFAQPGNARREGNSVDIELQLDDGETVPAVFEVRARE